MASSTPGNQALKHIDQAIAERPSKNDLVLSQATMCLAEFRDRIVADGRANGLRPAQRKQLAHLNAVITIVLGVHFPLGEIPWPELNKARDWLAEIVDADELVR